MKQPQEKDRHVMIRGLLRLTIKKESVGNEPAK